jgi:hypothetical protein
VETVNNLPASDPIVDMVSADGALIAITRGGRVWSKQASGWTAGSLKNTFPPQALPGIVGPARSR